jgi:hypothetical protein
VRYLTGKRRFLRCAQALAASRGLSPKITVRAHAPQNGARRAARRVRKRALKWLRGVACVATLVREVKRLAKVLHRRCGVVRRQAEPSTLDRLAACDPGWEEAPAASPPEAARAA